MIASDMKLVQWKSFGVWPALVYWISQKAEPLISGKNESKFTTFLLNELSMPILQFVLNFSMKRTSSNDILLLHII